MLERQLAVDILTTKYRGSRFDNTHAIIFTFPNGKQVATENTKAKSQRTTFSLVVNALPPNNILNLVRLEHYPRGGKRPNHNITQKDAKTLYWQDHDTWRIYPDTPLELEAFLDWYIGSSEKTKPNESHSVVSSETDESRRLGGSHKDSRTQSINNNPRREPAIATDAQNSLESDTRSLKTDEREAVVKVRFGQGGFREALFQEDGYGERCWMSGIEGGRLLIASHIKPWSHCEDDIDSRGRTDNGLLLSSLWDAAFDAGLIGFDSEWNVVESSDLKESARSALGLNKYKELPGKFRTVGRKDYLAYHLAKVFECWMNKDLA